MKTKQLEQKKIKSNGNLGIFSFVKWQAYKKKSKEKVCKSNQYQVENCPALPGWNLISTCNRRVKFVSAGRDEISTRLAETDFTLQLDMEIKFLPGKVEQFSTWYWLDLHAFSLDFFVSMSFYKTEDS